MLTQHCRSLTGAWATVFHLGGRCLLALIALGVATPLVWAAAPDIRDLQHEILVREALAKDQRLEPLNVVVRMKNHVATLSGPVPTSELAQRAVDIVKALPEVHEVRNNMMVQSAGANLFPPAPVTTVKTALPITDNAAPPLSMPPAAKSEAVMIGVWVPVSPPPVQSPTQGVALLPWVVTQPGPTGPVSLAKDNAANEAPAPPDAAAISSAVKGLLQSEERFRRLRFELKQGKVYLSGIVGRWADLEDLARAAARIPGVEGVVIREVRTEAAK